jgi:hypothetical protein
MVRIPGSPLVEREIANVILKLFVSCVKRRSEIVGEEIPNPSECLRWQRGNDQARSQNEKEDVSCC